MSKGTDLRANGAQSLTDEQKTVAAGALAKAAGHLAVDDPDGLIYGLDLTALVGAMVYEVGLQNGVRGGREISRVAREALGEVPDGVTRVEFAVTVAQAARAFGYDWSADDNRSLAEVVAG
ncbi:hypothetical protein [Streptomyces sp. Root369]|uniref:hypothetical protein n=1 Tax=Streptomyces sp. Root369 TaxID=1736523 RepID=UPI00070D8070|nr:hypothetical protein [Streptomyces sp. Root369]KQW13560.1 hypothetical protein ASD08_30820 [Streptomyces sp. Root369]